MLGLGVRDDVPQLLKTADVLLLPSIHEGLPGVVLEACASGTPVLASDLPGVREIASRLPLVRYLPLTAADEEWADSGAGTVERGASPATQRRFGRRVSRERVSHRPGRRGPPSSCGMAFRDGGTWRVPDLRSVARAWTSGN